MESESQFLLGSSCRPCKDRTYRSRFELYILERLKELRDCRNVHYRKLHLVIEVLSVCRHMSKDIRCRNS